MSHLIALDLEATGLDTMNDRIVEYCLVKLDANLNEVQRMSGRVNPGIPIPEEVALIHGIRDEDVAELPNFGAVAQEIQAMVDGEVLMSYNHRYDLDLLHNELIRHGQSGIPMDAPVVDPYQIFRENFPHSLVGAVRHYTGEDFSDDAHGAEADTDAMIKVYRAQIQRHGLNPNALENQYAADKRFLDRDRKFYVDQEGTVRFAFGAKFRDEPVVDRLDILLWMQQKDFTPETKEVIKKYLPFAQARHAARKQEAL